MPKTRNDPHRAQRNKMQTEVRKLYRDEVPENLHEYEAYKELMIRRKWNHNVLRTVCKKGGDYLTDVIYKNPMQKPYHEVYRNLKVAIWFLQKNWDTYKHILQYFHPVLNIKEIIVRVDINLPNIEPESVLIDSKGPVGLFNKTRQKKRKMREILRKEKEKEIFIPFVPQENDIVSSAPQEEDFTLFVPQEEDFTNVFSSPEPDLDEDTFFSEFTI